MNIFITGISSGIGHGLCRYYLAHGHKVWGVSRRGFDCRHEGLTDIQADLSALDKISSQLNDTPWPHDGFDLVILNAGVLGELKDMKDASVEEMKEVMDINLWANTTLVNLLLKQNLCRDMVITISSGAAVNGNRGWCGYSLSKAALNMMTRLYAVENPDLHFIAFAPGLVDTAMQDYICDLPPENDKPSLAKIQAARGTANMPSPDSFSERFNDALAKLKEYESGAFVDIRKM